MDAMKTLVVLTGIALATSLNACSDLRSGNPVAPTESPVFNHACDGSLPYFATHNAGLEYWDSPEVEGSLATGCGYMVVTGFGGRIIEDSQYETIWLTGKMLYHDGTWSSPTTRWYDNDGENGRTWEAYTEVPAGHAVVGIGIGQSRTHAVKTVVLKSREVQLVNGQLRLVGPTHTTQVGTGSIDTWNVLPETNDREVFIGIGVRSSVEQTKMIRRHTGVLY